MLVIVNLEVKSSGGRYLKYIQCFAACGTLDVLNDYITNTVTTNCLIKLCKGTGIRLALTFKIVQIETINENK